MDDKTSKSAGRSAQPAESAAPATAPALSAQLKKQLREASATAPDVEVKRPVAAAKSELHAADSLGREKDVATHQEPAGDPGERTSSEGAAPAGTETTTPDGGAASGSDTVTAKAIEDPKTDEAVDEILATEADTVLAAEDEARAEAAERPRSGWRKFGGFFVAWWANKLARWIAIIVLLGALVTVAAIPRSRYFLLNTAGVRSTLTLTALEDTTQLPLKNVTVSLGAYQGKTDSKGVATLHGLKLGTYALTVQRLAFAPVHKTVTVGWGSNQLGDYSLHATGVQYAILVTDYVSGKGVAGAEASSGEAAAVSDSSGKITLTVSAPPAGGLPVTISASGYRSEQPTIPATATTPTAVTLVPSPREVYVSKLSGTYGVYGSDIDGQNTKLLLAGTGLETANMQLATSLDGQRTALVSTRDNTRDADGYLLSTLTLVNTADGSSLTLEHAEQIQLIDWVGTKLIYETVVAGVSAANSQRERIYSYDYKANAHVQLASANQFNLAATASGVVYYAVSSTDPAANAGLYKINVDNTGRQRLFNKEVWSAFRTDYGTFALQSPGGWFSFALSNGAAAATQPPSQYRSRHYVEDSSLARSLWVDGRDGKGVLQVHDDSSGKDTTVVTQDALAYPVRWLGDDLVLFRVASNQETADYVVRPSGGPAKKVADVTNAYSFSQGF